MSEIKPVAWMDNQGNIVSDFEKRNTVKGFNQRAELCTVPLIKTSDLGRGALECALVHLKDKLAESDNAIHDTSDLEERQLWKTNSEALRKHITFLQSLLDVAGE